eukprot:3681519-Rhodomonas_salina.1
MGGADARWQLPHVRVDDADAGGGGRAGAARRARDAPIAPRLPRRQQARHALRRAQRVRVARADSDGGELGEQGVARLDVRGQVPSPLGPPGHPGRRRHHPTARRQLGACFPRAGPRQLLPQHRARSARDVPPVFDGVEQRGADRGGGACAGEQRHLPRGARDVHGAREGSARHAGGHDALLGGAAGKGHAQTHRDRGLRRLPQLLQGGVPPGPERVLRAVHGVLEEAQKRPGGEEGGVVGAGADGRAAGVSADGARAGGAPAPHGLHADEGGDAEPARVLAAARLDPRGQRPHPALPLHHLPGKPQARRHRQVGLAQAPAGQEQGSVALGGGRLAAH